MTEDKELLDRVRRIETRITKIGHAMGVDVGGGRPTWDQVKRRIELPSPNCSISECLNVVPPDLRGQEVQMFLGEQHLCTVFVG